MSAYLFSSLVIVSRWVENNTRVGPKEGWQTDFNLSNRIFESGTPDEAESQFRASLVPDADQQDKIEVKIVKISGAQFVDGLLTETGTKPVDWLEVDEKGQSQLETAAVDNFEQGYWVDVNSVVRPDGLSESIEGLRAALPEDIRSGLNWAPEKQFYFVLTVFSTNEYRTTETPDPGQTPQAETAGEPTYGPEAKTLDELCQTFPQIRDKEVAALILARNSVVAAWLWRRYAKGTRAADNEIRIDEWMPIWSQEEPST